MAQRTIYSSGSEWEPKVGYSRAARVGNLLSVAGTTAAGATIEEQTRGALETIKKAIEEAGATLENVTRTRMFVTDATQWEAVGKVHAEYFGDIRPATTIVGVAALVDPSLMIEIEADAWVD